MTAPLAWKMLTLDCPDPPALAAFYAQLLGGDVAHAQEEYAMVTGVGTTLGFGQVPDHQPPGWPNERGTKQYHLDLACVDIDEAAARVVELGGTIPDEQPGETWRVALDPAGHPFCLTDASRW
ncbi:putative enzyme related to lactoylglutathione lyase [Mumia flava]|uniref:Putative enzyme related to lactoylglutathione lyase n=1 Tax=Mumia flava TaxID=1348852 RepID=A0A0B2B6P4_9ACTN|nr:VOC family protein [Mumia flava]PJJ57752.1 putative enzyme related to lactoylglutathione lyase [Mumia flava]